MPGVDPSDVLPTTEVVVVPFRPEHQDRARALILSGLAERWGGIDESLNPDLDDIGASFSQGAFVVALLGMDLVGTGGLRPLADGTMEIVRMSIAPGVRRRGLGRHLVDVLVSIARDRGASRVICETTSTWSSAIALYLACGFSITHEVQAAHGRDTYFELRLD